MAIIRANVERVRTDAHQVIEDARYFGEHHADVLGAVGTSIPASFLLPNNMPCSLTIMET